MLAIAMVKPNARIPTTVTVEIERCVALDINHEGNHAEHLIASDLSQKSYGPILARVKGR